MTKDMMIQVINNEIEDRTISMNETDADHATDLAVEIQGLRELLIKVAAEQPLIYSDYQWLAYLVAAEFIMQQEMESA